MFFSSCDLQLLAVLALIKEGYYTKDKKSGSRTYAQTESYTKKLSQSTAWTTTGSVVMQCQPSVSMENSKSQNVLKVRKVS